MIVSNLFLVLAAVCAVWSVVAAAMVAKSVERHGLKTPPLFIGTLVFRNLSKYKEVTRKREGRTGLLFYSYVVPINLAWIFVLAAWKTRTA